MSDPKVIQITRVELVAATVAFAILLWFAHAMYVDVKRFAILEHMQEAKAACPQQPALEGQPRRKRSHATTPKLKPTAPGQSYELPVVNTGEFISE